MKLFNTLLLVFLLSINNAEALNIPDSIKKKIYSGTQTSSEAQTSSSSISGLSTSEISQGLKEALQLGVEDGVKKLQVTDGYFKNEMVKILLPEELQTVDRTLRMIGLGNLADEGVKLLNRAAEDAVIESTPIFTNAITSITFDDANSILLGNKDAATTYLRNKTTEQLVSAFKPKIEASLGKVGADKAWSNLISRYNSFTKNDITPDLNVYVTEQAIVGVFKMVAEKEAGIRDDLAERTSSVLQKVFGAIK